MDVAVRENMKGESCLACEEQKGQKERLQIIWRMLSFLSL